MAIDAKACAKCGETKPLDEYHANKLGKLGRHAQCKACVSDRRKAKYADGAALEQARAWNWGRYGLTPEDYAAMLAKQEDRCAICGGTQDRALSIDHCHATSKVRGLLCVHCNTTLGAARDDPAILRACADYLERHR